MLSALYAALVKDLRLLARDRVGLVFLTIAPVVVITVAGLSLASLYGADPRGTSAYLLPFVDEDGGSIGTVVRERLAEREEIALRTVESRAAAVELVRSHAAGVAVVIPAGTSAAIREGRAAPIVLLTDPAKYLEVARVRAIVQELRHRLETAIVERARHRIEKARRRALVARARLERRFASTRRAVDRLNAELERTRRDTERRIATATSRTESELRRAVEGAREREARARARLASELAAVRTYLGELDAAEQAFERWLAELRERAGPLAARIPPPPSIPPRPPEIAALARGNAQELIARVLPEDAAPVSPPAIIRPDLPATVALPEISLPPLPEAPPKTFPGALELEEASVTGAPRQLNTFDQNVPGFSVTFLLLGVLLGISLGLLDERDWGTLDRLRATPAPFAAVLVAKLLARFLVGLAQMTLLFAVGRVLFGVSLGPEPGALLLPTAGIVFAGTAFGLLVAGAATTREAVLPLGSMAIVTMAAVGGCWWPIDLEPQWMRHAALAFPTTWAMAAYNDLMIRRQPISAALVPTAVLFAYGIVYLLLGLALFRRHLRGLV